MGLNDNMLDSFLVSLSSHRMESNAYNMYAGDDPYNKLRLRTLGRYLKYFLQEPPPIILIGEAPGYRGCRISGIPFTSTDVILRTMFFHQLGINDVEFPQREATASIVWDYFDKLRIFPLLWNAFPFHPHLPGNDHTNRKPSPAELQIGRAYLEQLLHIFQGVKVAAVGQVAQAALARMSIKAPYVRHPSYGGRESFIQGLSELLDQVAK